MPMKPINLILFLILLLAGCVPVAAPEAPTAALSRTPSLTTAPTHAPTATLTPTPLPQNACPATDEAYQHVFPEIVTLADELFDPILDALNNGITLPHLQKSLNQVQNDNWTRVVDVIADEDGNLIPVYEFPQYRNTISIRDLTGDGVNEVIFTAGMSGYVMPYRLQIYTCQQGKYIKLFNHEYHYENDLDFLDLNGNSIPEIIIHTYYDAMHGPHLLYIYEWDGESFRSLIPPHEIYQRSDYPGAFVTSAPSTVDEFQWNSNGIFKVIIRGYAWNFGGYDARYGPPRDYYLTLTWDGTHFQAGVRKPDSPEYRFQAVQDGDWETWRGNYEQAMAFYNQALYDPTLKSWGDQDCLDQWKDTFYSTQDGQPTPTPCPPDPNEQTVLKAYLHYRYMLIYIAQGKEHLAQNEYLALTQLYKSHPAYPLKGLATTFWDTYQATQDLAIACDNADEYNYENYDVFRATIGNSWYLWRYGPMRELLCPFENEVTELTATSAPTRTPTPEKIPAE